MPRGSIKYEFTVVAARCTTVLLLLPLGKSSN